MPFSVGVGGREATIFDVFGNDCAGLLGAVSDIAPDFRLIDPEGEFPLILSLDAGPLLVHDQLGNWHCDAVADGAVNSQIILDPVPGQIEIWGGFRDLPATLSVEPDVVDEIGRNRWRIDDLLDRPPPAIADRQIGGLIDETLTPIFGELTLKAAQTQTFSTFIITPFPNDVVPPEMRADLGSGCRGFISAAPSFRLSLGERDPAGYELRLSVKADSDTTLVVRDPDGNWHCGVEINPLIDLLDPSSGNYDIWFSVFTGEITSEVELNILLDAARLE